MRQFISCVSAVLIVSSIHHAQEPVPGILKIDVYIKNRMDQIIIKEIISLFNGIIPVVRILALVVVNTYMNEKDRIGLMEVCLDCQHL